MRHKTPGQANLQRRIILALDERSAESVSELARRLAATRPSVSRSLKALARRGHVARRGRVWSLTAEGKSEMQAIATGVPRAMQLALKRESAWQRTIGQDLARAARSVLGPYDAMPQTLQMFTGIEGIARSVAESPAARLAGEMSQISQAATSAASLMKPSASVFEGMNFGGSNALSEALNGFNASFLTGLASQSFADLTLAPALTSILETQRLQTDALLQGAAAGAWWNELVADSLMPTSRIIADISAMPALVAMPRSIDQLLVGPLLAGVSDVVSAHAAHAAIVLGDLTPRLTPRSAAFIRDFSLPARGTATFVSGARDLLTPREERSISRPAMRGLPRLESLIAAVDQEAAEEWRAAWHTLEAQKPGWSRGAAHHGRESLRLVLTNLAPDTEVPRDSDGRITQRARVMCVLSGGRETLRDWAIAQAQAVRATYDALAAEAHSPRLDPVGLAAVLEASGSLMQLLLTFDADRQED
ncbi:MAG: MarR family winged helix-turn-helix transcriptional regulator [Chloroflexota bacterium]